MIDMKDASIKVDVDMDGVEEATEKVQELSDAIAAFPAQVIIRGARNCKINIYPSQTMIMEGRNDES